MEDVESRGISACKSRHRPATAPISMVQMTPRCIAVQLGNLTQRPLPALTLTFVYLIDPLHVVPCRLISQPPAQPTHATPFLFYFFLPLTTTLSQPFKAFSEPQEPAMP